MSVLCNWLNPVCAGGCHRTGKLRNNIERAKRPAPALGPESSARRLHLLRPWNSPMSGLRSPSISHSPSLPLPRAPRPTLGPSPGLRTPRQQHTLSPNLPLRYHPRPSPVSNVAPSRKEPHRWAMWISRLTAEFIFIYRGRSSTRVHAKLVYVLSNCDRRSAILIPSLVYI